MSEPMSPESARELLEADWANIVELVTAGQPLSARHRKMLEDRAGAPSAKVAPAETSPRVESPPPLQAPPPAAAAPEGRMVYTRAQLEAWGAVYETKQRQIRRWLNVGADAGDPTPIDSPGRMPSWWERMRGIGRLNHRCPEKILAAARKAGPLETAPVPENSPEQRPAPLVNGEEGDRPDLAEGEEVKIARGQVAVASEELEVARVNMRLHPDEPRWRDNYTYWARQLNAAMETFRKHKSEDRENQKARGLVISRAEVTTNAYALIKMLGKMRATMVRGVRAELRMARPDLPDEVLDLVAASIEKVRGVEEQIFRRLAEVKSESDLSGALGGIA